MRSRFFIFLISSATAVLLAGCAQMPLQTLHEAEKSLEEARKAGAELYAIPQFKAAQVSFELAKKEIFQENRKLPFMRKYKKITETLNSAIRASKSAQAAVNGAKTKIRAETEAIINKAGFLADTARALLNKIPAKDTTPLSAELDSVKTAIAGAEESLGADNLLAAKEKAFVAQEKITALTENIRKLVPAKKSKSRSKKR
jgi:hypothetical protein